MRVWVYDERVRRENKHHPLTHQKGHQVLLSTRKQVYTIKHPTIHLTHCEYAWDKKKEKKRYFRKRRNIEETNNQNCREWETSSHSLNKAVLSYTYPTAGVFSSICSNYLIPYPFELYSFMFHLLSLFYLISCMMHEFVWCSVLASSSLRIYDFTPHHNAPSLRDNTLVLYFLYFI